MCLVYHARALAEHETEKRKQPGLIDFSPDLNNRIVQDYYVNFILFSVTALFLLAFEHLRWRERMDIRTN